MKSYHASTLLLRSLRFHWRSHLGVLLGATLATVILVGALAVGDSMRFSLEAKAYSRLGGTEFAIANPARFFRTELATEVFNKLSPNVPRESSTASAVLRLRGSIASVDGQRRVNRVQVLAFEPRFRQGDDFTINERLASQLEWKNGESVVIRIEKPSELPRDAPLSTSDDFIVAARVEIAGVRGGNLSLEVNQVPPSMISVPLEWLQKQMGLEGRANLILLTQNTKQDITLAKANEALRKAWQLADAELELRALSGGRGLELRTKRVFLDPPVGEAVLKKFPEARGVLTYFVNELRKGDKSTPYSMVAAMAPQAGTPVSPEMADNEIILNNWLAEDLDAKIGDDISLKYFVVGPNRKLEEQVAIFLVKAIVPIDAADQDLMPQYPGLEDAESCRDWDAGIPIDFKKIRPKDEEYWKQYRGTPKAFVTLAAGQKLWSNRFGNLTAIRFPANNVAREVLEQKIRDALDPAWFGLTFQPVREQALKAAREGQDFGQLFLGLSFFLIIATLLLMGLLFAFGLEQRTEEIGTLLALGWTARRVRRVLLLEGLALALVGGLLGTGAGLLYTKAVLWGLTTIWRDAVRTTELWFHAEPTTLLIGGGAGFLIAWFVIWLGVRRMTKQPARALLSGSGSEFTLQRGSNQTKTPNTAKGFLVAFFSGLIAIVVIVRGQFTGGLEVSFFIGGALLLVTGLAICWILLSRQVSASGVPNLTQVGARASSRRRGRSLAAVAMLACGIFLVIAVGANRHEARKRLVSWYIETTIPITDNLRDLDSYKRFNLRTRDDVGIEVPQYNFVSLRLHEGDEASCLNLNRAQQPRLLGINPAMFRSEKIVEDKSFSNLLSFLNRKEEDNAVPAIGDEATVRWALGKRVGDAVPYTDEHGKKFLIRIVGVFPNSVFQGSLLISENNFSKKFPSESGYRVFLVDFVAPLAGDIFFQSELSGALRDYGAEVQTIDDRLAQFQSVENTYLSIFQALGGLGLLLGSVGLGVVVLRNVLERRSELAILRAVGFSKRSLRWMVLSEHCLLLILGLATGVLAAAVAVFPALRSTWSGVPYGSLALTIAGLLASGVVWIWLATLAALRGNLLRALRKE